MAVIKKSGEKEEFDINKFETGLKNAISESGLKEEEQQSLISDLVGKVNEKFSGSADVNTSVIRDFVIGYLEENNNAVADAWKAFENKKG